MLPLLPAQDAISSVTALRCKPDMHAPAGHESSARTAQTSLLGILMFIQTSAFCRSQVSSLLRLRTHRHRTHLTTAQGAAGGTSWQCRAFSAVLHKGGPAMQQAMPQEEPGSLSPTAACSQLLGSST